MPRPRILVVDDEQDVREHLCNFIGKKFDCEIESAADGETALEKLKKDKFDLVLMDIKMPGLSGIDVINRAVTFTPQSRFLVVSGYDSQEIADQTLKAGAIDFLPKPQTPQAIEIKVKGILEQIGKYQPK